MAVSVIISNFNGACWLPRLLETVQKQQSVDLEVIVVDRYSTDESERILAVHPETKIVKEPPEAGLVAGYLAGAAVAQYDHLFFCNEDMWLAPDCLRRLESEIDPARQVACADPWQWSYDGSKLIHSGAQIDTLWNRGSPHPWHPFHENESLTCGSVIACASAGAMMIHRHAYDQVGGWDASFFLDQEDTDLAIRLWQRGWLTVTVPEAKIFHAVGGSNTKILSKRKEPVAKRRYVYALANQFIVVWKLFSPKLWLLPLLPWSEIFLKDVVKLRCRRAVWDFLALKTSLARLPRALCFRRINKTAAKLRRGELFYQDPNLQFGACVEPRLESSGQGVMT